MIFYKTMRLSFKALGDGADGKPRCEQYTFDPQAGLALKEVIDLSGNKTTYAYGDTFLAVPNETSAPPGQKKLVNLYARMLGGELANKLFFSKYSDPTSQTDARGQGRTFTYQDQRLEGVGTDAFPFTARLLVNETDERGTIRKYGLDGNGRREWEEIILAGENGPAGRAQRTELKYENGSFPGVVTERRLKADGPEPWEADLVTKYQQDATGHTEFETLGDTVVTQNAWDRNGNNTTA
jgi:hypothetical protein